MNRKEFLTDVLVCVFACFHATYSLDYSYLEALGVACPPMDTCDESRSEPSFYRRNCQCDSNCTNYADCCIDAVSQTTSPPQSSSQNRNNRNGMVCLQFGDPYLHKGVYVVNTCQENWGGPEKVRQKCEDQDNFRDPLKAAPVVDTQSKIAYRNVYCSECNNIPPARLITFLIGLKCNTLPFYSAESYVFNNLEYNVNLSSWGVNGWNSNLNMKEFHACDLIFKAVDCLEDNMRLCLPNMISSCPFTWPRSSIRRFCESYQAVVKGNDDKLYKNPHCALCNGLAMDEYFCFQGYLRNRRPTPFTVLIDVNQSGRNETEVNGLGAPSCPSGQKYDPFLKRCRPYVRAVPDYEIVTGTCIKS